MFGTDAIPTKIYQYGVRRIESGRDRIDSQMQLAARYKNALIARERDRRSAMTTARDQHHPDVPRHLTALEAATAELAALQADIAKRNAAAKRKVAAKDDRERVAAAKERRRGVAAQLRAANDAAYTTPEAVVEARHHLGRVKRRLNLRGRRFAEHPDGAAALERLACAERDWFAADPFAAARRRIDAEDLDQRKALRAASSDLYWCTRGAIEQDLSSIRAGAPPEFVRWDGYLMSDRQTVAIPGEGRIAVQLQGGLAWLACLDCSNSQFRVEILQRKRRHAVARIWLRVGSEGTGGRTPVWATIRVKLHREPPANARVQWVYLHRDRIGTTARWSLSIVVAREDGWARGDEADNGTVAIEVGWRRVEHGLRVAVYLGSDGRRGELVIPERRLDDSKDLNDLQALCRLRFNEAVDRLANALAALAVPDWLRDTTQHLRQWKSQFRLAALYREWRDRRFAGDDEPFGLLESWYRTGEAHGWWAATNHWAAGQTRLRSWRDYLYRDFVVGLRRRYRRAVIEATDWHSLARRPEPQEQSDDAPRRWSRLASVGRLSALCREGFADCVEAPPAWTTRQCHACGHRTKPIKSERYHTCEGCAREWDVDENAAANLLAAATQEQSAVE